jgi:hypothetical protein
MAQRFICDACGREADRTNRDGWLHAAYWVYGTDEDHEDFSPPYGPGMDLDLCPSCRPRFEAVDIPWRKAD